MSKEVLKPCPFCGCPVPEVKTVRSPKTYGYYVAIKCPVCECESKSFWTKEEPTVPEECSERTVKTVRNAIAAWNVRVNDNAAV